MISHNESRVWCSVRTTMHRFVKRVRLLKHVSAYRLNKMISQFSFQNCVGSYSFILYYEHYIKFIFINDCQFSFFYIQNQNYYRYAITVHKQEKLREVIRNVRKLNLVNFFFMKGIPIYFAVALDSGQNCVQQQIDASLRFFRGPTDVEFGFYSNLYQMCKLSFYYFRSQCKL